MRIGIKRSVAKAICCRWGLPLVLCKAHKYISRWLKDGRWSYRYPSDQRSKNSRRSAKLEVALKTTPITGIQPLLNPTQQDVEREIEKLKRLSREGKLVCPALGGRNVHIEKMTATHLKRTRGKKRLPSEYAAKVKYLPFVQEILKHGKISEKSYRGKGVPEQKRLTYGVICLVKYSDMENGKIVKKTEAAEVAVAYDKHKDLFVLSFASYDMKKALPFKAEPSGCLTVVSPASLRATIPLRVDMFRSKTPISSQSLMQPRMSIPQPPKKTSEISRFTVKKSVAKTICRRWGLPLVQKSVSKRATAPMPARASPKLTSETVTAHKRSIPQGKQNASRKSLTPRLVLPKGAARDVCKGNTHHDARGRFAAGGGESIPTGRGDFGDIYECFKGKPNEAIRFLLEKKDGEAVGALHHKDVGDIDLVWGKEGTGNSDGYGLAKLARFHPEVLDNLQGILDSMSVVSKTENRVQLESAKHKAGIRLEWNGKSKKWLLTAYEKENGVSDSTTDIARTEISQKDDYPFEHRDSSIPHPTKNASDKSLHHSLVVKKSVAKAICRAWGLPLLVSKAHKYISRWAKNGHWSYRYPSDQRSKNSRRSAKLEVALKTTPITGIQPLVNPTQQDVEREISRLKRLSREGKLVCPALGGRNVHIEKMTQTHAKSTKGVARTSAAYARKVKFLPLTQQILQHGRISEVSYRRGGLPKNMRATYGIICRVRCDDRQNGKPVKRTYAVEVAVAYDKKKNMFVLSFADFEMKKALPFKTELLTATYEVSPASLIAPIPCGAIPCRSATPISSQSLMQPRMSIPQSAKNASEKSKKISKNHPRFMVRKSVARAICRAWGLPLLCKSNPHHDVRGRFAAGGCEDEETKYGQHSEAFPLELKEKPPIQKQLGKVDDWLVAEAAKSGVNIEGDTHEITDDFIRHVKKEHGDAQYEAARGNVAVTDEDFAHLKDVIENPDFVAVGIKNKRKQNIIAYAKELDDGTALYFEEVLSVGKKKLNGETFYKKKKKLSSEKFTHILTVNKKNNFENMRVIQRVVAKSTLALPVNGTRCRQPSPTTKGIPSTVSIPHSPKNASDKSFAPRLVVRKSVAKAICRAWGLPCVLKSNPHHDARGRFASCGGKGAPQKNLSEYIEAILNGTAEEKRKLAMTYFQMAETPQKLKDIGLTGDSFTVRYGVISRYKDKDVAHNLSAEEWKAVCKKLENADNLVVAKRDEGFNIFLGLADTTLVGITVKNAGKNLIVNSVKTVFKRDIKESDVIVYPVGNKRSPEQSALLNRKPLSISASDDLTNSVSQSTKKASPSTPRFMLRKSVADAICCRWGLPLVLKSVKTRRERFLEIKAALLKHCKQKLREAQAEEAALRKAIIGWERLEKAASKKPREKAHDGDIRTWGDGKKYRRVALGKWVRVYQGQGEAESKGGVRAWKNICDKLATIDDEMELAFFVQQNKMRFIDDYGYPLPAVEKLSELAQDRNDLLQMRLSSEKVKQLEDEAIEREGYEKQIADIKAKVDQYVKEDHTLEELQGVQAEVQALHDDIHAVSESLNNRGSKLLQMMRRLSVPLSLITGAVIDAEDAEHERQAAAAKQSEAVSAGDAASGDNPPNGGGGDGGEPPDEGNGAAAGEDDDKPRKSERKNLSDYIETILNGTAEEKTALARTYFEMAKTPKELKDIGLTGDSFTVRYGVISRHKNKNEAHNLSVNEWKVLCKRLENADNLVVAKRDGGFNIFLALPDTTLVGVSVKNAGKDFEVNSVKTVFKREIKEADEIVYPVGNKMSPEQSALLDRKKLSISASGDTDSSIPQSVKNASEKSKKDLELELAAIQKQGDDLFSKRLHADRRYKKLDKRETEIDNQLHNDKILERYRQAYLTECDQYGHVDHSYNYHRLMERHRIYDRKYNDVSRQKEALETEIMQKLEEEGAFDKLHQRYAEVQAELDVLEQQRQSAQKSLHPRFMVRKSVARQILRAPLPRLAFTKSGRLVVRK